MNPGIVIVTHNSAEVIGRCLDAALRYPADIVVIDNASSDATAETVSRYSGVRFIANAQNAGFAAAVNQGMYALENNLVLLLNPDAFLETPLDNLVAALSKPNVAAAAGLLVGETGAPQRGFTLRRFPTPAALSFEALGWNRLWPGNPVNRRYRCADLDLSKRSGAEQPPAAFLMLRRDVWRELGGFNEAFHPLWFEDVDYLRRLADSGYRVRYEPSVRARHGGGHSIAKLSAGCRAVYWYGSLLKYASTHFSPLGCRFVCASVALAAVPRMAVSAVLERSLKPLRVYATVFRLAGGVLLSGRTPGAGRSGRPGTQGNLG